jgi:hypothetical protein
MNPGVSLPACPKCQAHLGPAVFNLGRFNPCPNCEAPIQIEVFTALFRPVSTGTTGEAVLVDGEAACFYHESKKAVVVCDACGRFLCALCDCKLNDKHYCPGCLEAGGKKRTIEHLETVRPLHGRQAFMLSVLPFFITGLAAIFIAIRHWKSPGSLVTPQRWQMPVALVLAILQTLGFVILIISAFIS